MITPLIDTDLRPIPSGAPAFALPINFELAVVVVGSG
jgi:hypothetical protein